ncbi:MAG: polymorphic toxin-type HINT domain-containing protein [Mycobacteriales bacterium]
MVQIRLTSGGTLTATDHHPFWNPTTRHWTNATDLRPGDQLREPDGTLTTVTDTRTYTADLTAYNLTIDTTHTYYVEAGTTPVLVHNCSGELDDEAYDAIQQEHGTDVAEGVDYMAH